MKRALVAVVLASTIAVNGCIGSFSLTNNLYKWNEKATDSKYVNSAILWVLGILPVYDITLFVDFVLFNTIEFYGGKKPRCLHQPAENRKGGHVRRQDLQADHGRQRHGGGSPRRHGCGPGVRGQVR